VKEEDKLVMNAEEWKKVGLLEIGQFPTLVV